MKRLNRLVIAKAILLTGWLGIAVVPSHAAGPTAIRAGKLIPIQGEPLENAVVLIENGKIVKVGTDIEIPVEAKVIDASQQVVMPGFIDVHNAAGMSQANERNTNVPFLSVVDSIDPALDYFEDCRRNGITTAAVVPGNNTMIGGQAAVLKTAGGYVNDMLLRRDSALKISLQPVGSSRMSHIARLRAELDKAKRILEAEAKGEKEVAEEAPSPSDSSASNGTPNSGGEGSQPAEGGEGGNSGEQAAPSAEQTSEGLKVLQKLLKGEIPAYIYCESAMDVGQALRLVDDYKIKPMLVLGPDCYKAAALIGERKLTVILDPTLVFWETDPQTRTDKQIVVPKVMLQAEVPFVFQVDGSGTRQTLGSGFLWYQAATGVKYGLKREQALRAMTLTAAELLGVDSFVGSLEPGKDADLVILSGDPLAATTWVEKTIVAGEEVYSRGEDRKLKQLLEVPAQ